MSTYLPANSLPQPRPNEERLDIRTKLTAPIASLSFLRKSLLFAELSLIAYNDDAEVRGAAAAIGFDSIRFYENDGSQAYKIANEYDCVITCRGTEPNEWNDIKADAQVLSVISETVGRVHKGFKTEVDDLWPLMEKDLVDETRTLYFTGHSLGGAMSTISAARCRVSSIKPNPQAIYSFGSPRVGNKRYINDHKTDYKRWVNNNDIVTQIPPIWMGYHHGGEEIYIDYMGRISSVRGWQRTKDRLWGFLKGLGLLKVDHLADHSIYAYIKVIVKAICEEEKMTSEEFDKTSPIIFF